MIRFTLLLALLTAFPPLSTDMYLPAIPLLQRLWETPLALINLTLVLFFVVYCASLLIYGPLADRFGRKPPLVTGIAIYILGSLLCALSHSVYLLIAARIFQALGAASASAVSMAMTKDRLSGKAREKVMGYVSVIMALAPMAAPMIGSLILELASWEWIFAGQALLGLVALTGVLLTPETLDRPTRVPVKALARNYVTTLANKTFMGVTLCTSLTGLPFFAFIGTCSPLYIRQYGLDETTFSLFFGGNALTFMAGAMACARLTQHLKSTTLVSAGALGITLGGVLMATHPFPGPWSLAIPMGIISFALGISRPPANSLALGQVTQHAGAASSLLVFIYFILGALSMGMVSLLGDYKQPFIAGLAVLSGGIVFFAWRRVVPGLRNPEPPEAEQE